MLIVDRYVFRNVAIAAVFVIAVLAVLVLLTQSLRFLEFVINSGASGFMFWALTLLTLPKFFEIILPIGLMASAVFVYNRMIMDSELVAMRALGFSPFRLARPALLLSGVLGVVLFFVMGWIAPLANDFSHQLKQSLRGQMGSFLFREGIFNQAGKGLMVYVRERESSGNLRGLLIHDSRDTLKAPSTIIADSGVLVITDEGQKVLVYDGSRQDFDTKTSVLKRLDFRQYTIDLPSSEGGKQQRWKEPDERSFTKLFSPDLSNVDDRSKRKAFRLEIHRRLLTPFLVPGFTLVALLFLLQGPVDRRGQSRKILMAISIVVLLQILYLGAYNLAKQSPVGYPIMYLAALFPMVASLAIFLRGERIFSSVPQARKDAT